MIKEIEDYLEQFQLNKPLFRVLQDDGETDLKLVLVRGADLPDDEFDPIKRLIKQKFEQRYEPSLRSYKANFNQIESQVITEIKRKMVKFVERNSGATKPRQTKLYRWLYRCNLTTPVTEGLFLLYKYVASCCNNDTMLYLNNDDTHLNNVFLILEAMQKRYS